MKKLTILAIALCLATLPLVGCKKKTNDAKTFARYFSSCTATENNQLTTYTTDTVFKRNAAAYTSLKFIGSNEWTDEFKCKKLVINFYANETRDVDMIILVTTNGNTEKTPYLVCFNKDKTTRCEFNLPCTFMGTTTIEFRLTNAGDNGHAGDIFNQDGFSNGFNWKIEMIELYGSH